MFLGGTSPPALPEAPPGPQAPSPRGQPTAKESDDDGDGRGPGCHGFAEAIKHWKNEAFQFKVEGKDEVNILRTRTKMFKQNSIEVKQNKKKRKVYSLCSTMGASHSLQIGLLIPERL